MTLSPLDAWIAARIGSPLVPLDRTRLAEYQHERLGWLLDYVRTHSPFYRDRIPPGQVPLTDLPFTTSADLRDNGQRMICLPQDQIERIITLPTSGTTGQPKRIHFSAADQELTVDFFRVGMSTLARPGDRVLVLFPSNRPGSVGALLKISLERLGCTVLCADLSAPELELLQQSLAANINIVAGAPSQILRLAAVDDLIRVLPTAQIRAVLSSSDVLYPSARVKIERIWSCEVFDHFGMTETGLGGGVECDCHRGSHLREADLLFEIIDPDTGRALPPGQQGELVFTTLTRDCQPLIRYRTGDIGRLFVDHCPCGSNVMRLEQLGDRPEHRRLLSDGTSLTLSDIGELLTPLPGLLDFTCEISNPSGVDTLTVTAWPVPGAAITLPTLQTALQPLSSRLTIQIDLADPASPPTAANSRIKRILSDHRTIE